MGRWLGAGVAGEADCDTVTLTGVLSTTSTPPILEMMPWVEPLPQATLP